MFIDTSELSLYKAASVSLRGWLQSKRDCGKIIFLTLRDGRGLAQIVCESAALSPAVFSALGCLPTETPLLVTGMVCGRGKDQACEVRATTVSALPSEPDFPIGRKEHGPEFLMDRRHLWLRSPTQAAYLHIRSSLEFACESVLRDEGFFRFDSPLITPTSCEGTTELFELDYFGRPAYLSQSAQLYSEAGIAALGKVYAFGPCFRAEKSQTRRHLAEFWGVEPEAAWMCAEDNMALQERFIKKVLLKVAQERVEDLAFIGRDPRALDLGGADFPVVLYDEALSMLADSPKPLVWGEDLSVEQEEWLASRFDRPFFIYKYPVRCRAFYIEPDPERPELALSSDCLMHGGFGEIITGGQRASDRAFLESRMREHGLALENFSWYLDLRRWGSVPHSGFGMGIERMMRWICGLHHIRETIPFARTPGRVAP